MAASQKGTAAAPYATAIAARTTSIATSVATACGGRQTQCDEPV